MPVLYVQGIPKEELKVLTPRLKDIVVDVSGKEPEHVKIYYSPSERMDDEEFALLHMYWLPRPKETCDRLFKELSEYLYSKGQKKVQLAVMEYVPERFYRGHNPIS